VCIIRYIQQKSVDINTITFKTLIMTIAGLPTIIEIESFLITLSIKIIQIVPIIIDNNIIIMLSTILLLLMDHN